MIKLDVEWPKKLDMLIRSKKGREGLPVIFN